MPSQGGRYENRNGKRELVHRTNPTPTFAKAPAKLAAAYEPDHVAVPAKKETAALKPAKAAKQEVTGNE